MRKPQFYARLAANNLWRNRQSYLPYLLACVTSIFTLYCLWAILYSGTLAGLPYTVYVESFTLIGGIITAIFCSVLLFWTNAYLIKRRKKELALYSILGMEKRNIAIVMLFETLYIAVLALGLGILGGMLLSRLLFAAMLRLIQQPVDIRLEFSMRAVTQTALFFGVVFLLILVRNLRQVRLATPSSMLAGAKQGEREPRASWLLVLLGIAGVGGGYYIAFTAKNPGEALFLFLLAVVLVIIGTYCLFTAGSVAVLKLLRRNKGYYYQPGHFISVSGMLYRMKQNAAGLASICILSCMVLVTVASTITLYAGADDSLENQFPYQYAVNIYDESIVEDTEQTIRTTAEETGVTLVEYAGYRYWGIDGRQAESAINPYYYGSSENPAEGVGLYISLMTLAEYNEIESAHEVLQNGEALIHYTEDFNFAAIEEAGGSMDLFGETLAVRQVPVLARAELGMPSILAQLNVVLPDETAVLEALERGLLAQGDVDAQLMEYRKEPSRWNIHFDVEGTDAALANFHDLFAQRVSRNNYETFVLAEYIREDQLDYWYVTNGGFLFLGIYFGIMFLLATVLIIYYKQVSEGYEDHDRFDILQKVGMSEREVRKTINSQVRMVFYLPLAVAVVHIAFAMFMVRRVMILFAVLNTGLLVLATVCTVLLYALVYLVVYRQTAHTYFRLVRREV